MGHRHSSNRKGDSKLDKTRPKPQINISVPELDGNSVSNRKDGSESMRGSISSSSPLPGKQIVDLDVSGIGPLIPSLSPESPVGLVPADQAGHRMSLNLPRSSFEDVGKLNRAKSAVNPVVRGYSSVSGANIPIRSKSLPLNVARRADTNLDQETLAKVIQLQEKLREERTAREQSNSAAVSDEQLRSFMADTCDTFIHGVQRFEGIPGQERAMMGGSLPPNIALACIKGSKGVSDTSANQDNYSYSRTRNGGIEFFTVQDGHGTSGHMVSYRSIRTLPYFIMKSKHFPSDMRSAIAEGYRRCHEDLVKDSLSSGYDIQISGCACVLMIKQGSSKIWTSHTGDSRIVIGKIGNPDIVFETEDHKPTNPGERSRLEDRGSAVVAFEYEDGQVSISRVFVKGTDYPGLCMSRSLGDQSVKNHGVTAEPDIAELDITGGKPHFVVLASDGVWEFISSKLVASSLSKKLISESLAKGVDRIVIEAKKRWKQYEGSYCDDITAMLITL